MNWGDWEDYDCMDWLTQQAYSTQGRHVATHHFLDYRLVEITPTMRPRMVPSYEHVPSPHEFVYGAMGPLQHDD